MTNIMYEMPSRKDVAEVRITKEFVRGEKEPVLVLRKQKPAPKLPDEPKQLQA